MNILVTGGSGFIGGAVVRQLEARGYRPLIVDIKPPDYYTACQFVKKDIVDGLYPLPTFDLVFHSAGVLGVTPTFDHIKRTEKVNVLGTLSVLQHQQNQGLIVQPCLIGDWLNPYMISKKTAERYGLMFREKYGTNYVSLRLDIVYGPRQSIAQDKMIPNFVNAALNGEDLMIYGDGSYMNHLWYIEDCARACVDLAFYALEHGISHSDYDEEDETKVTVISELTSTQEANRISVRDVAERIISLCQSKSKLAFIPMRSGQPDEAKDSGIRMDRVRELTKMLNFRDHFSLDEGLKQTIEYYRHANATRDQGSCVSACVCGD